MKNLAAVRIGALALVVWLTVPGLASAQTTDTQRIDRLEATVRTLTGQVEELTFRLQQFEQQLTRMQQDNEYRFQQIEVGTPGAAPAAAAPAPAVTAPAAPATIDPAAALNPAPAIELGTPPATLGMIPATAPAPTAAPVPGQPLDLGQVITDNQVALAPAGVTLTGNPQMDYDAGYQFVLNGDYAQAEQTFRTFVLTYPGDARAADAQYWVAETLFSRAMYSEAVPEYLTAYRANPASDLAPAALYKLGLSYLALNEVQGACDSFGQVLRDYPNASNALRQSVAAAQANARCAA